MVDKYEWKVTQVDSYNNDLRQDFNVSKMLFIVAKVMFQLPGSNYISQTYVIWGIKLMCILHEVFFEVWMYDN